jgi:hypothetical protein
MLTITYNINNADGATPDSVSEPTDRRLSQRNRPGSIGLVVSENTVRRLAGNIAETPGDSRRRMGDLPGFEE